MQFLNLALVLVTVTLSSQSMTLAFPTGSGTCFADSGIVSASPMGGMQSDLGINLSVSVSTYSPVQDITVQVQGTDTFMGILLYAVILPSGATLDDKTGSQANRYTRSSGTFVNIPTGYSALTCAGASDASTLTHSSNTPKKFPASFQWKAPMSGEGDIAFVGIVVKADKSQWQVLTAVKLTQMTTQMNPGMTLTAVSIPTTTTNWYVAPTMTYAPPTMIYQTNIYTPLPKCPRKYYKK